MQVQAGPVVEVSTDAMLLVRGSTVNDEEVAGLLTLASVINEGLGTNFPGPARGART